MGAEPTRTAMRPHFTAYAHRLAAGLDGCDWSPVEILAQELLDCWKDGRQVFFCGNGGSAANANHLVNDLIYPVSKIKGSGIRAHSLSTNSAALTCIGNDEGYQNIFAYQLAVHGRPGDVLVVLSGSGNSPNVVAVLDEARRLGIRSFAILGFSGGKAKMLADVPIHFAVDDMQIAEDLQMAVGHMVLQWLYAQRHTVEQETPHKPLARATNAA